MALPAHSHYNHERESFAGNRLMDEWLNIVVRQLILYSLPVLVSLTLVSLLEARSIKRSTSHPFYAIAWRGTWLPLLAALFFHRGIIIALPHVLQSGIKTASARFLSHGLLFIIGFFLFAWGLAHQAPAGLPPLHHWWAKVFMFFNLCMAALHLLPLPMMLAGESLAKTGLRPYFASVSVTHYSWLIFAILAASPLLDLLLGTYIVFPVYEAVSSYATQLATKW